MTSRALALDVDPAFVRTHRGYYRNWNRQQSPCDTNDYLSFKIGMAQRMYGETNRRRQLLADEEWTGGLGYAFRAKDLLARPSARASWGNFSTRACLEKLRGTPQMEEQFLPLLNKSLSQLEKEEEVPPKEEFLLRAHLARKADRLTADDQGEINLYGEVDRSPELPLDQTIVFIPKRSKAAFLRLLRIKLQELRPWTEKLQRLYGIDLTLLTPERILERTPTIYWYPQENSELAIEYVSTHPAEIDRRLLRDA